ncbi:MAG: hypothetical protein J5918_06300 [Prevotella sp.]|nr:hypothetical protein [Prevotella sp.]
MRDSNVFRYLGKDHHRLIKGNRINELPRSVYKGLVACRDTTWGVYSPLVDGE